MSRLTGQSFGADLMPEFLNDPFLQSSLFPLLLAAGLAGVLRGIGGRTFGRSLAALAPLLAFGLVFVWVIGVPAFPPPASLGKGFWLLAAGGLVAAGFDASRRLVWGGWLLAAGSVAGFVWIAGAQLMTPAGLILLPLAGVAVAIALGKLETAVGGNDLLLPQSVIGLAWAAGVGGVALLGASAALAQAGLSLAAAIGGWLLWNWPRPRDEFALAGRMLLLAPLPLALVLLFFTQAQGIVLPILLLVPLAVRLVLRRLAGRIVPALLGMIVTLVALLPALLTVALAAFLASGAESSGY